jgi:hypothetical protein
MTELDRYLAQYYLNEGQLLAAAALGHAELAAMIDGQLVPAPSYVVSDRGTVTSFVFGEMAATGTTPGRYFHPSQTVWIARARAELTSVAPPTAAQRLQEKFCANFASALTILHLTTWRIADSFDDTGAPRHAGLQVRLDSAWKFFLNGTFGLCVANPISEAHIAYKEVLQEKLVAISENGSRSVFAPQEARKVEEAHALIDAYAAAAMLFSPVEYPVSSRKRLVEDFRTRLLAAAPAG